MNLRSNKYKLIELFVIFVLIPVSFAIEYSVFVKILLGTFGFIYVVVIVSKIEKIKIEINNNIDWRLFWKTTALRFLPIAIITFIYVYLFSPGELFSVIKNNPLLYVIILLVYTLLSVYPQELIYRTFFFTRYSNFFENEKLLIFINAILFSLAHLFFNSFLVLIITFIGGLLFGITYARTKSTFLVSIEHAIYGCWLFTVGLGNILGFPS